MPRAKRTRQASNPRRLILPLGVVTVLVVAVWVALSSGVSLGKTYADGWNDYTFRYPSNATLAAGDTTGGLVYVLPPGAKVADLGGCIVQYSSDPNARYNLPNFDSFRPLPSASYNGLTWHGTVFTSKSAAGDTKYYMWASGHLSVQARDPYADMCERVLKTITLARGDAAAARTAHQARSDAVAYLKTAYPGVSVTGGVFRPSATGPNQIEPASYAVVTLSAKPYSLTLHNDGGKWQVVQ